MTDLVDFQSWISGLNLLRTFEPRECSKDELVRNTEKAVQVIDRCRSPVDYLLSVAENVVASEVFRTWIRVWLHQL